MNNPARERWAEAAQLYERALADAPEDVDWRHSRVVRAMSMFAKAGPVDDTLRVFDQQSALWQHSPDFHVASGNMFLDIAIGAPRLSEEPLIEQVGWFACASVSAQIRPAVSPGEGVGWRR